MNEALIVEHDRLMAQMPEGAEHGPDDCAICRDREPVSATHAEGATVADDKTRTEAEYAALEAQVEELTAKVAELTAAAGDAEVEARIAAAKQDLESQISELQAKLDTAAVEAETAKQALADTVAYLEAEEAAIEQAAALEARKADRIARVKEIASFSEDHLEANAARWAAMDDETFEATLADWKAVAAKVTAAKDEDDKDDVPATTALTASAERKAVDSKSSPLREVLGLRSAGHDIRTI